MNKYPGKCEDCKWQSVDKLLCLVDGKATRSASRYCHMDNPYGNCRRFEIDKWHLWTRLRYWYLEGYD